MLRIYVRTKNGYTGHGAGLQQGIRYFENLGDSCGLVDPEIRSVSKNKFGPFRHTFRVTMTSVLENYLLFTLKCLLLR